MNTVRILAPPQNLTPRKSVYVVWDRTVNLGQMIVGQDRASEFVGIIPLYEFRILVTAEEQSDGNKAQQSSGAFH
jgi:hypothetical protein